MAFETILLERDGALATLTLNRPDVLNSFNEQMISECTEAFRALAADREVRALVVTGAGRGFCAGQDLADVQSRGADWSISKHILEHYNPMVLAMRALPMPVIAAVNGAAAGAGMSFALAADMRIASVAAKFLQAFVSIGLVPDSGSSWFLPRLVGPSMAFDLCATGRALTAEEALRAGIVSRVVPRPILKKAALEVARELATKSPEAIRRIKEMLRQTWTSSLEEMLALEARLQDEASRTPEYKALVDAFLAKSGKK